jgi:AcrR family transcriptional regulator
MARPRKVSDEQVYEAAMRVMSRVGPSELTLAAIAAEAGVTAGALVQRFGSKRDLMLRMSRLLSSDTREFFRRLRAEHDSPLEVIRGYAACMADMAVTPEALTRNFAYLQADLEDPDLREQLLATARETRRELLSLVRTAKGRGELRSDTPPAELVSNIEAIVSGALLTWAFHRKGKAADWLRRHVDGLLRPYLARPGT